ncbi:Nucleolin 2 [Spatholobus suberectus]|nr:Nucleolin 2 [Spatholobus suberectus]
MDNSSDPKVYVATTALLLPQNGTKEGGDEDEKQLSARDEVAEELKNKAGATAMQPPRIGKREGENEDEKQENAKKQKRDDVAEEQKNKEEIVSDDSFSDSEPDKVDAASNAQDCDLKNVENDSFSDSIDDDDDGDDNSYDVIVKPHMVRNPMKSSDNSENSEEEIEEKASKTPEENPKMLATSKEQNAGSKTIYAKNLSYSVERADLDNLFKECGQIVDIRLHTDREGRFRGFGHVEFATAEAAKKALELHNTELLRRLIRVGLAREKGEYAYNRSNWSNSLQKCDNTSTVFVKGFDSSLAEEKIKASLEEHFGSCGEIVRISVPKFHDSGSVKGFAHLEFKDVDSMKKALHLDQTVLGGYHLLVEKAKPRCDNHGIGGGGHQLGGRDGSGYSSRVDWGRSGGGGGHQFGGRDGSGYSSRVDWGRSGGGGGHQFGGRDGNGYSSRVGWGRSDGGGHQFGGRDGSDYSSRVGWGRSGSGGGWHSSHFSDEGTRLLC